MKKALRVLKTILIIAAVLIIIALLLKWGPLDNFLTSKIGKATVQGENYDTLIRISGYHHLLDPSEKPYVFNESDKLFVLFGGNRVDITPPGVSSVFYGPQSGIADKLRYRDHACFDVGTTRLLYIVDVQNVPELFMADLVNGGSVKVADNVDSFMFLGGKVIYAQGYDKYNKLFVYSEGESRQVAENSSYVPVAERGGVLFNGSDGSLSYYSTGDDRVYPLSDNSDSVIGYSAFSDSSLITYCRSGGNYQSVLFDRESGKAVRSVIDTVPDECYSGGSEAFVFEASKGKIRAIDAEGESAAVFGSCGHIYKVFFADARGGNVIVSDPAKGVAANGGAANSEGGGEEDGQYVFKAVFATKNGIYLGTLGASGEVTKQLCSFKGDLKQYSSYPWLITYHMEASGDFENGFYLSALSGESSIWNKKNPQSWLNRFSSYVYRLFYVSGGNVSGCDVPSGRTAELPVKLSGNINIYSARYVDGTVKSLSSLEGGNVLTRDILKSSGAAKGSVKITAEAAEGKLYITVVNDPGASGEYTYYCTLEGDGETLYERSGNSAVSFGQYYSEQFISGESS